jgi:GNAT superfamily N-acetyltransferase
MVNVRPATPGDAAAVARVHDAALRAEGQDRYSSAELDAMAPSEREAETVDGAILGEPERYVVVAEAPELVGVAGVHLESGRLFGVFVDPERTGEGLGRVLFEAVTSRAREAGLDRLTVRSALNAAGFYEACGFEPAEDAVGPAGGPLGPYPEDVDIRAVPLEKEL